MRQITRKKIEIKIYGNNNEKKKTGRSNPQEKKKPKQMTMD